MNSELLLIPAISATATWFVVYRCHQGIDDACRHGVIALRRRGLPISFDPCLLGTIERRFGLLAIAGSALCALALFLFVLLMGEPDAMQKLAVVALPPGTTASIYNRRVLVAYWTMQAVVDGIDLGAAW